MRSLLGGLLIACAASIVLVVPASAELSPERQACDGSEPQYSLDQQIAGCTAVIEGGGISQDNLASAYSNRGVAYYSKGQYDKTIADNDRAIALKPDFANAFYGRGMAYARLGQCDRGMADANESFRLDPNSTAREVVTKICASKGTH